MANTFNKYYLNQTGLQALIAKIKANDNQLAAVLGLDSNWASVDTTAADFKSTLDVLEEKINEASSDALDKVKNILGYNAEDWPTDNEGKKLTVNERLKGLSDAIATLTEDADAIKDTAENAFNDVNLLQDNTNQVIDITFSNAAGATKTLSIDTTDFIVHGMLSDVIPVNITDKSLLDVTNRPTYVVGGKTYELPDNVLIDMFGKTDNITAQDVTDLDKLPLSYLVLVFGVHPDPNDDGGVHGEDADKEIWVNTSDMVKQYDFTNDNDALIDVTKTESGGVTTVKVSSKQALTDAVSKVETLYDGLTDSETGELIDFSLFPTTPISVDNINEWWNSEQN